MSKLDEEFTKEEIDTLKSLLEHGPELLEMAELQKARSIIRQKYGAFILWLAGLIAAVAAIATQGREWLRAWLA